MAEYDEDYNGEDLEMSGVNIERGKFVANPPVQQYSPKNKYKHFIIQIVVSSLSEALSVEDVQTVNPR